MTVQELKDKMEQMKDSVLIIDVREEHEWNQLNIGGELIPLGKIAEEIDHIKQKSEGYEEVAMICRSGKRSGVATHLLKSAGLEKVYNVEGGLLAWADAFGTQK